MELTLRFIGADPKCALNEDLRPTTALSALPEWYKKARLMPKGITKDQLIKGAEAGARPPITFKSCVPFFDAMTCGYVFTLPCDIEIISTDNGCTVRVTDPAFTGFIGIREPMEGFHHPEGYYKEHFHWQTMWGVDAPTGWSVMFVPPLNRYDLPFLSTSGIIDSDASNIVGRMPFFVKKGYNGIVPKGTPFIQLIPIQRANWASEFDIKNDQELQELSRAGEKYRPKEFPFYGAYKKLKWVKKNYN
jgi:hypothetical protein